MATLFPLPSVGSLLAWSAIGYVAILALYRCFLGPLARIPGPRLAALTYWYECYYGMTLDTSEFNNEHTRGTKFADGAQDVVRPAQYVFKIKELHARGGGPPGRGGGGRGAAGGC